MAVFVGCTNAAAISTVIGAPAQIVAFTVAIGISRFTLAQLRCFVAFGMWAANNARTRFSRKLNALVIV